MPRSRESPRMDPANGVGDSIAQELRQIGPQLVAIVSVT